MTDLVNAITDPKWTAFYLAGVTVILIGFAIVWWDGRSRRAGHTRRRSHS